MTAQPETTPAQTYQGQIRPLLFWPKDGKLLKLRSLPVPEECIDTDPLKELVHDMLATMYATGGVGLSAIQVGIPWRLFVMDVYTNVQGRPSQPRVFVNPEIEALNDDVKMDEGCLSFPTLKVSVSRPERIRIKAVTHYGTPIEQEFADWHARVALHEFDHLDGVVLLDRLSGLSLRMAKKSIAKFQRDMKRVDDAKVTRRRR